MHTTIKNNYIFDYLLHSVRSSAVKLSEPDNIFKFYAVIEYR